MKSVLQHVDGSRDYLYGIEHLSKVRMNIVYIGRHFGTKLIRESLC